MPIKLAPLLFYRGKLVLITSLEGGRESEKLKIGGGSMVQGQVFLKGGWHFSYLIFSRFIIFTFRNYFTKPSLATGHSQHQLTSAANIWCILQLMMTLIYVKTYVWTSACVAKPMSGVPCSWWWLCQIALLFAKLCYVFEEKLWKKIILSCLKMNLKISHTLK